MVGKGLKSKCSLLSLDNLEATASGPMAGVKQFHLACKSQVGQSIAASKCPELEYHCVVSMYIRRSCFGLF